MDTQSNDATERQSPCGFPGCMPDAMTGQRWRKHLLPFFGSYRAVDVTTDLLEGYVEKRRLAGAANGTINREFSALKRAFTLGFRSTPRKVQQVPLFPHLKESAPR